MQHLVLHEAFSDILNLVLIKFGSNPCNNSCSNLCGNNSCNSNPWNNSCNTSCSNLYAAITSHEAIYATIAITHAAIAIILVTVYSGPSLKVCIYIYLTSKSVLKSCSVSVYHNVLNMCVKGMHFTGQGLQVQ